MLHAALLDRVPLFRGLSPGAVRALTSGAVLRRYPAGAVLWTAGAPARGLHAVLSGRVRVVRGVDGRQVGVHEEGPGAVLGEIPLFDGLGYPATALAATPVECVVLDRPALSAALAADPELAWRLLAGLGRRVRGLVARLEDRAVRSVGARLAARLLERGAGGGDFDLGAPHADVAEELGTVREVLVRTLRRLREEGVLESAGRGRYRIVDVEGLRARATSSTAFQGEDPGVTPGAS